MRARAPRLQPVPHRRRRPRPRVLGRGPPRRLRQRVDDRAVVEPAGAIVRALPELHRRAPSDGCDAGRARTAPASDRAAPAPRSRLRGAVDPPLRRRHRHVVRGRHLVQRHPLDRARDEERAVLAAQLVDQPVVAGDRLAPFEVGEGSAPARAGRRSAVSDSQRRRWRRPISRAHDVDADAGQEPAHRARLAQRADAAEEADEDLLQQVLAIGPGTEQAAQRLVDAGREAIPGRQLRLRIAAPQRRRPARRPNRRRALALQDSECRLAPSLSNSARIPARIGQEKYQWRAAPPAPDRAAKNLNVIAAMRARSRAR